MSEERNNHKAFRILIPDALTSSLDEPTRIRFEQHLAVCSQCREEYEKLRSLFGVLGTRRPTAPPNHYFANLLPRIRQRLEKTAPRRWSLQEFLWSRWTLPVATLAISIVLISHLSLTDTPETNGLQSVVGTMSSDELADALYMQVERESLTSAATTEIFSGAISDRTVLREMFRSLLEDEKGTVYLPLGGLSDLNDQEVDALLRELNQRSML